MPLSHASMHAVQSAWRAHDVFECAARKKFYLWVEGSALWDRLLRQRILGTVVVCASNVGNSVVECCNSNVIDIWHIGCIHHH